MKKISRLLLILLTLLLGSSIIVNAVVDESFTETGGVGYRVLERKDTNDLDYDINHFTDIAETKKSGTIFSQQVNVLEVPTTTNAKIVSFANLNNHKWTTTTVRNLARQYEEENPSWKIIAGINADFFDIGGNGNLPYQTSNVVVTNGEYYKTSYNRSVVGFTNDGSTTSLIGGKPTLTEYMKLAVYDEFDNIIDEFDIEHINSTPGENQTAVYFGTYDTNHTYVSKSVETGTANGYYVEEAELALPNKPTDFYGKGVISSTNPTSIERGQFAIVSNNQDVIASLEIGVKIRTQFEFTGEFANITSATGFDGHVLHEGEYQVPTRTDLGARHPRTTIGVREDGTIVMATIDGRNPGIGLEGIHGDEMAAIMKRYGCVDAYNLDGGGSTTMMIRQDGDFVVVNRPSDGNERKDSNALLIAIQMPEIDYQFFDLTENSITMNAEVFKENGLDIQDLYIEMNGVNQKIEDNTITFTNLTHNTEYYYRFRYRDSIGDMNDILVDGRIKTLKRPPEIIGIEITEVSIVYEIKVIYDDPDNASFIKIADIKINDQTYFLNNGEIILLMSSVGNKIDEVSLSYEYDLNDGRKQVILNDFAYTLTTSIEAEVLDYMFNEQNIIIFDIYK